MGSGRRCGCWALDELELERSRHQVTLEENKRYARHVQDLRDELSTLHATVAELERKYAELSARHRNALTSLDEVHDTSSRLRVHSTDVAEENRRMRNNSDRLQEESSEEGSDVADNFVEVPFCPSSPPDGVLDCATRVHGNSVRKVVSLRKQLELVHERADEERRQRLVTETSMSRDLQDSERRCDEQLSHAASVHDLDAQHLREDILRLEASLEREKIRHGRTKRNLHYVQAHHLPHSCQECLYCPL